MSLSDAIGPPQVGAALVLLQRGLEEFHSARNTRALLADGAREVGGDYYPVVAVAHLAWLAGVFFLVPANAPVSIFLLGVYLALQGARYWIIATLGRYWTHRIITLEKAPIVRAGPYKIVRHPNYLVTLAETFVLPAMFGAWALGAIFATLWSTVLSYKILLEDSALADRRARDRSAQRSATMK